MSRRRDSKREKLLEELSRLKLIIRGSYLERFSRCIRESCECHQGKKHGPRGYITSGRPARQRYVRQSQRDTVKKGVEQYQRLIKLADELTEIHLEMMSEGKLDGS